jgi:hypothetical protein
MRTHSMTIGEFMNREPKVKKVNVLKATLPVIAPFTFIPVAHAEKLPDAVVANGVQGAVQQGTLDLIAHAFDPVVDVAVACAFPVASAAIAWTCISWMIGRKDKAIERLQNIGIGYCAIQLLPFGLEVLKSIGDSL